MLNPLKWKVEHLAGLLVATLAGAVLGIAFGFTRMHGWTLAAWISADPTDALTWAVLGAVPVGAAVYCYRVFSN